MPLKGGVVPNGQGGYLIARQAATGFPRLGNLKAEAMGEANQYCQSQGSEFLLTSENETQPPYLLGNYQTAFQVSRARRTASAILGGGNLAGICGVMLTTLALPSEAWLLIVSSTRKNFSASIARPHWWLISETYTPAACADTAIELGAIAASRQPPADGAGSALMSGGAIQSFRAR